MSMRPLRRCITVALAGLGLLLPVGPPPFAQAPAPPAPPAPDQPAAAQAEQASAPDQPAAPGAPQGPTEGIVRVELRREGGQLNIHFVMSSPPHFDVVENLPRQVLVVKFHDVRPAFPGGQTQFLFNDPMVAGIAFETVGDTDTWAKVRLRAANLTYSLPTPPDPDRMVLGLKVAPPTKLIRLTGLQVTTERQATRVTMALSRLPQYEGDFSGIGYQVRLAGVTPRLRAPAHGEDDRVRVERVEQEGEDTVVRIALKKRGLNANPLLLTEPARLEIVFREPAPAAPPAVAETAPETPAAAAAPKGESLELLLEAEPNRAVRANYTLAEREFRTGRFGPARQDFLRVFNANPGSKLGIRAYFRAADAEYELLRAGNARNYHNVIINYQTAIRHAEEIGYESDLIPHAFFRIARSYQHMGFHNEAHVHFTILQQRFPNNPTYTVDSYFYQGQSFTETGKYEQAVEVLREFLQRDGDPRLVAPALYRLGDALYNLKRYTEAGQEFDRARRADPDWPNNEPVVLFHMGETYYENAKFDVARTLYRTLLQRYPSKPYSKLVGLRLGDFLREEGKEADALRIYGEVVKDAPLEIRLRGKMRIANILANRPVGDDYKAALKSYDEVIEEGEKRPIVEEALMRKALTQTLHNLHREAVATFQQVEQRFPKSPYVRNGVVARHIVENLQALVDGLFAAKEYWEVAKVYTTFRDPYFLDFRFKTTLFQVARSYHYLGLYDDAIRLYDKIEAGDPGSLGPLVEYQRALAFTEKDDFGKAEEALLKFIQAHPKDPYIIDARMQLGKVYFEGRRYQDALNAYRIIERDFAKEQDPKLVEAMPEVNYQLGRIYKELGQLKEAADAYRAAVETFHHPLQGAEVPEHIVLSQFTLGDVLFELGQDPEAIAAYKAAIARYPDHEKSPWAQFQIGLIHRRNGREREALEVFNSLVELAKTRPGELWETLAKENQRDLVNSLGFQNYLKQ